MDTDDLSRTTYKGIILEAENFNHDLTLQFGLLASDCKDDDDYLNQAEALIIHWLKMEDKENLMDDIFFGEKVSAKAFKKTIEKILFNINEIKKTPMEKREFEDWG